MSILGERDVGPVSVSNHGPLGQPEVKKENPPPTPQSQAITLSQLQQVKRNKRFFDASGVCKVPYTRGETDDFYTRL